MEPDKPGQPIANVRIEYSKFLDNARNGIEIAGKHGQVDITIAHNVSADLPSARMRSAHLPDRRFDAAPVLGLRFVALLLAFGSPLGGLYGGFVAVRANQTPRVLMDVVHVHWNVLPCQA
jgi:hypothetical protein